MQGSTSRLLHLVL